MEEKVLHINLIGEFRLCWGNVVINHEVIRQRKGRSLLKLLAITPGHALQREQIMDVLWPETSPEKAANSLYNTVYFIRRELNQGGTKLGELMVIEDETVRINPGLPTRIDLEDFVMAAAQAFCDQDLASCQAALGQARLAEGDFLAENRYDDWAEAPREAFRQEVLRLQRMTARLHEAAQDWEAAIEAYSHVLAQEPLDESACAGLMRAYAGSGQREAALRQYMRFESLLKTELGTRPSPEMARLAFSLQAD